MTQTLLDQERVYADAVLMGVSPRQARVASNLPASYAAETYNPAVRDYMDAARGRLVEEAHISRAEVINGFKRAIDDAIFAGDPANQIAGWREIGKMLGYYEPAKVQIELSPSQAQTLDRLRTLTDSELIQLASTDWGVVSDGHDN